MLKTLRYIESTSDIETGEVMLFIGDYFVVTVRHGEGNPLAGVRQRLESQADRLDHGPLSVLHAVMDSVVDNYLVVDREVRRDLEQIEEQVFASDAGGDANTIYRLKREVLEFRRATQPLADTLSTYLERTAAHGSPARSCPSSVTSPTTCGSSTTTSSPTTACSPTCSSAHLASVSVKQNADMRRISAWVAIAAVPTMIAGIYGMNFELHARADRQRAPRRRRVQVRLLRRAARHGRARASGSTAPSSAPAGSSARQGRATSGRGAGQVALSQPAPSTTATTTPRITRYQTKGSRLWLATKRSSHAMVA